MKTSKLFWGLLVIGAGVLLLLYAFGLGAEYDVFKIIGSLLLLAVSVASLAKFRFVLFFIPLALIAYLWRVPLGIASLNIGLLLAAAALLGIGLSVLFRKRGHHHHAKTTEEGEWGKTEEILNENEFINIESNLGENIKYIHASNLKRVKIKSNFASTKVYFDQCQISSEGLEINISGNFSEVILNIPKEWSLDNRISAFAGAVTNLATRPAESKADVKLTGSVNFAELKILYV